MKRFAAAVLLVASVASAQTQVPKKAERKTVLIFEDGDDIASDRLGPMVDPLFVPRGPGFKSIITVRESFKDKAMQSVHEL